MCVGSSVAPGSSKPASSVALNIADPDDVSRYYAVRGRVVGITAEGGAEHIERLARKYLGSLPSIGRKESWRDVGVRPPTGVVSRTVLRGTEPKSQTALVFTSA